MPTKRPLSKHPWQPTRDDVAFIRHMIYEVAGDYFEEESAELLSAIKKAEQTVSIQVTKDELSLLCGCLDQVAQEDSTFAQNTPGGEELLERLRSVLKE